MNVKGKNKQLPLLPWHEQLASLDIPNMSNTLDPNTKNHHIPKAWMHNFQLFVNYNHLTPDSLFNSTAPPAVAYRAQLRRRGITGRQALNKLHYNIKTLFASTPILATPPQTVFWAPPPSSPPRKTTTTASSSNQPCQGCNALHLANVGLQTQLNQKLNNTNVCQHPNDIDQRLQAALDMITTLEQTAAIQQQQLTTLRANQCQHPGGPQANVVAPPPPPLELLLLKIPELQNMGLTPTCLSLYHQLNETSCLQITRALLNKVNLTGVEITEPENFNPSRACFGDLRPIGETLQGVRPYQHWHAQFMICASTVRFVLVNDEEYHVTNQLLTLRSTTDPRLDCNL